MSGRRCAIGRTAAALAMLGMLVPTLAGCEDEEPAVIAAAPGGGVISGIPGEPYIVPGPAFAATTVTNPYADDPSAVDDGEEYYLWYNCGGCHGVLGGGGMGPPLRDDQWIYGDDPVSIYASIMQGRPEGMPTWEGKIPEEQAWKIVAYVQSLGEADREPPLTPPAGRVPPGSPGPRERPGGR